MFNKRVFVTLLIIGTFLPTCFVQAGTILSSYKYAWSNNVGYINFENVVVSSSALSGYAWSENTGWIKFNPSLGGVTNDGTGNLSGSAWGEGLGWINFDNVSINSNGKFTGTATGDGIGTLTFDCPNYCDVRTDWSSTPASSPEPSSSPTTVSSSGSSSGRMLASLGGLSQVVVSNQPLQILPSQSGILRRDVGAGEVVVNIPANNVFGTTRFVVDEERLGSNNGYLVLKNTSLVNGAFYDVYAIDENNEFVKYFDKPITITLPLAKAQRGLNNLRLYWLNETNWKWVLIPDAVFSDDKVTFNVNHLTRFAIFSLEEKVIQSLPKGDQSLSLPADKRPITGTSIGATSTDESNFQIVPDQESDKGDKFNRYLLWILLPLLVLVVLRLIVIRRRGR